MNNDTPANILIIDDTPANLQVLASMLDDQGHYARPVNSGAMGIQAAQLSPPDLILLDIQMPGIDGFETCRQLKADAKTRDIPVIFISALNNTGDKLKAFRAGGVDYISKPFHLEEVQARVDVQIELQRFRQRDQQLIKEQAQLIAELDAFSHTVAHDLKTPLSVITGYAELLTLSRDLVSDERRVDITNKIMIGSTRMNRIINALLLLANVRKAEDLQMEPVDMRLVLPEVMARLELMIADYKPEFIIPESWPMGMGYAPWIEEVWANYASNAIKYGGRPPLIEFGADEPVDGMIRYWIKDNGNGITAVDQGNLFTPFTRLASIRTLEGHGLGLSIIQRIAQKMSGEVGVESTIGEGSLFYFTLPCCSTSIHRRKY